MKKYLSIVLSLVIILSFVTISDTTAMNNENIKTVDKLGNMEIHDISELHTIDIKDTYSYQEYLDEKLTIGLISRSKYNYERNKFNALSRSNSTIRYAKFRMDPYEIPTTLGSNYILQPIFMVGLEYHENSTSPDRIVELGDPYIYTGDGRDCIFTGNIFFRLESGNSFYYDVHGDVYKTGKINWGVDVSVGIGEYAEVNISISNGSQYIENISFDGRYYSAALSQ